MSADRHELLDDAARIRAQHVRRQPKDDVTQSDELGVALDIDPPLARVVVMGAIDLQDEHGPVREVDGQITAPSCDDHLTARRGKARAPYERLDVRLGHRFRPVARRPEGRHDRHLVADPSRRLHLDLDLRDGGEPLLHGRDDQPTGQGRVRQ